MYQNRNKLLIPFWVSLATALTLYYNACSEVSFDKMASFNSQKVSISGNSKVDILVIMDNSGSMKSEMASMATKFSAFYEKIKHLDFQIAIITTDNRASVANGNGKLIPLVGVSGQYILKPSMGAANVQSIFGATIQMPIGGSGSELGLAVTKSAVARSISSLPENIPNKEFFRSDAALAILIVSDAFDNSGSTPQQVIDAVKTNLGSKKTFSFHSIVVPSSPYTNSTGTVDANDPCRKYRESFKYDGRLYHELSDMTGGVKGTVCSEDYGSQLTDMGRVTAELINSISLDCEPVDANHDGLINAADVQIATPNGPMTSGYEVHGTRLTFTDAALPYGQTELGYLCLK